MDGMKKALIVTYYAGANYGAFWQAYGIGEYVRSCGYEVTYLRDSKMEENLCIWKNSYDEEKNKKLKKAIEEAFSITDKCDGYDLVVLGSDEIWNRESAMCRIKNVYWGQGIKARRIISYAPCAISTGWKRMLTKIIALKKLNGISVRDVPTQNIIQKLLRKNVQLVIDPTFLIQYDFVQKPLVKDFYIFVYSYGLTDEQRVLVEKTAKEKNLKIVVSGHEATWADINPACSPKEWLSLFKYASYIYTTTFHGSVFSLIFHKEVSLLGRNPKALALLKSVGVDTSHGDICIKMDDYDMIDEHISELRGCSLEFLNRFCEPDIPSLTGRESSCCGCSACYSICPRHAIEMAPDEEGFLYPHINANVCIRCKKCLSVCAFKKK